MLIGCGSSKKNSSDESKETQTKESQTNESESKEIESKTEENVDTSDKKETEDSSENETQKSDSKETANTTSNSGIYDELAAIEQQEKEIITVSIPIMSKIFTGKDTRHHPHKGCNASIQNTETIHLQIQTLHTEVIQ